MSLFLAIFLPESEDFYIEKIKSELTHRVLSYSLLYIMLYGENELEKEVYKDEDE